MTGADEDNDIKLGEFPFPLTDGPEESVYLTWLRNHSNYLAARGFLDYLRSVSVLVRGIIVNFLIFLPYILLIAVGLGYAHYWMLDHPFKLTLSFLMLAIVWILLFPVLMSLYKILSYTRSVETGTESTVKRRDLYERSFGGLLLLILATAFLESQPWILELGHNFFRGGSIGWQEGLASVAAVLALLSGSDKVLSVLSGVQKKLAMIVIGLLGLMVPLLVIIFTTVFLVYGQPPLPIMMYSPLIVAVVGVLALLLAIPLGVSRRAFTRKECAGVVGLLLVGLIFVAGVVVTTGSASEKRDVAFLDLERKIKPLQRVAAAFENVANKNDLAPDVSALVNEFVVVQHEYNIMVKDVENEYTQFKKTHKADLELLNKSDDKLTWFEWLRRPRIKWELNTKKAEFKRKYFSSAQQFINLGNGLSALPRGRLQPLRREVARLAHEQLHDVADVIVTRGRSAKPLRKRITFQSILDASRFFFGSTSNRRDTDFDQVKTRVAKEKFATSMRGKLVEQALRVPDAQAKYDPGLADRMVEQARRQAELSFNVQYQSAGALVRLVGVERLEDKLHKKVWDLTGKQELAKITGVVELANLVTDQEIVELIFVKSDLPLDSLTSAARNLCIQQLIGGDSVDDDDSRLLKYAGVLDDEKLSQELIGSLNVDEVRSVASRELAKLALSNFDAQQLAIILRGPPSDSNEETQGQPLARNRQRPPLDPNEVAKRQKFSDLQLLASRVGFEKLTRLALEPVDVSDGSNLPANVADKVQDFPRPKLFRFLLAEKALGDDPKELEQLVREKLTRMSLGMGDGANSYLAPDESKNARNALGEMIANTERDITDFTEDELASIAVARFGGTSSDADKLVTTLMFGKYGPLERALPGSVRSEGELGRLKQELTEIVMPPKVIFVVLLALVTLCVCWFTVDVNLTSIHGFNRDRLATAYLVGRNTDGNVDIEEDIDLEDICRHEARSKAPYHLVNVALNLQGSSDIGIRDRNSDFFIFSKRFIGGERTGYCRSETMEHVYPQISLATAMAVSAAAASPNMGRGTSPLLVAFMTLLNIRMGYWSPNPGLLEEMQDQKRWKQRIKDAKKAKQPESSRERDEAARRASLPLGFTYQEVFAQELTEVVKRWEQVDDPIKPQRKLVDTERPSVSNRLFGIAYSGGGIRSATINLGITQALHKRGVFEHADYMSTVSGGGYLGSSLSTLMRTRTKLQTEIAGTVSIHMDKLDCEIAGTVQVTHKDGEQVVIVTPEKTELPKGSDPTKEADWSKEYWFSADTILNVKDGDTVKAGDALAKHRPATTVKNKPLNADAADAVSKTVEAIKPTPVTVDQVVVVKPTGHGESKRYRFSKDAKLNVTDKENVGAGKPLMQVRGAGNFSEIAGTVSVVEEGTEYVVSVQSRSSSENKIYRFSRFARLIVSTGDEVKAGQPLVKRQNSVGGRFRWRVRPAAFLREMLSKLDENHRWVNLSDGGHLENLATIELLRRRCKYIIIGDGEADPNLHFNGLATLKRTARIDLGIEIDINLNPLRLKAREGDDKPTVSSEHWAIGKIIYPERDENGEPAIGYLLYLKSSYSGDEGEVITEYRHRNPNFPHETTADQFFDEGQFEAYRALGQHIAEQALDALDKSLATDSKTRKLPFAELDKWLTGLWKLRSNAKGTGDGSPATKG